jgi:hypothetical protein
MARPIDFWHNSDFRVSLMDGLLEETLTTTVKKDVQHKLMKFINDDLTYIKAKVVSLNIVSVIYLTF